MHHCSHTCMCHLYLFVSHSDLAAHLQQVPVVIGLLLKNVPQNVTCVKYQLLIQARGQNPVVSILPSVFWYWRSEFSKICFSTDQQKAIINHFCSVAKKMIRIYVHEEMSWTFRLINECCIQRDFHASVTKQQNVHTDLFLILLTCMSQAFPLPQTFFSNNLQKGVTAD